MSHVQCCQRVGLSAPAVVPCWGVQQRQQQQHPRSRHRRAQPVCWRLNSTLKSLDDILGSKDDQDAPTGMQQQQQQQGSSSATIKQLRVPSWAWTEVAEPRVVPLATNALYYLVLVVFVAYYVVALSNGQEAADDLIARLANDHSAVADGDALRLYTSAFVCDNLQALVFGLVGIATVASELESLLGYSTFWALISLCTLTGSLADAAISRIPITQGPGPAVAGVAAALLAYHARNWQLEQLLLQARAGVVPPQFMQLEADYNARQQQQQGPDPTSPASPTAAAPPDAQQQQQQGGVLSSLDEDSLVETDLDLPLLNWLGIKVMVPQEGKAFVTLGGMACGVLAAIREATTDDAATDWPGLMAAFVAGMALGWQVAPLYQLQFIEASTSVLTGSSSSSSSSGGSSQQQSQQQQLPAAVAAAASVATEGEGAAASPDLLLPVLRDVRPAAARANAVLGYAGVLFAVLGGWLLQQGSL